MAALSALAMLAIAACNGGASTSTPSPDATSLASPQSNGSTSLAPGCTSPGLISELRFDEGDSEFSQGDAISMALSLTNCDNRQARIFYTDGQRYEFIVKDEENREIWRWSQGMVFTQALGEEALEPGATVTYTEVWDQRDQNGEQVEPGRYEISGFNVGCKDRHRPLALGRSYPMTRQ
jgi:hypothetical protein